MKTIFCKQVAVMGILLLFLYNTSATITHPQTDVLLTYALHDSMIKNSTADAEETTSSVKLQLPVKQFVHTYLDTHDEMLESIQQKNSSSFKLIQKILVKKGIPAELMYLAVVESKMKNTATSGAGAAGIWQLMPVTARSLGLKVNGKTDQRRNIYYSTVAAADYLQELYEQFDDWLLVVAAYNCGSGNVYKAIKLSGSREFWKLQYFLPAETRNHVKRFIATHFYYKGEGSFATLTKKERITHMATLKEMVTENNTTEKTVIASNVHFIWMLIAELDGGMIFELRK
ncbi:MAG: lytic transglycosylase domain-containing protein [Chitinophagaceae bacterium]|jgi:membrane-bound lytic murein transglycosylase D|nr:lytic transglycosylase domain-containing protein [Chitinophagaceae bacterium]